MLRTLIGFALAAGLAISSAGAQGVAGTYAVDYDQLIRRMPGGRDSVARRGKAQLEIEVKGDSAFGTWTTASTGGPQRTIRLRGTRTGNSVKLVSEPQSGSSVTPSGTTQITYVTTYEATVRADAIVGTMTNQSQSAKSIGGGTRKFEGKREKR